VAEPKAPDAADLALLDPDGSFVRRLRTDRDALLELSSGLWATPAVGRRARLAAIESLAHRLAGAAGTFGYPLVGAAALELEDRVTAGSDSPSDHPTIAESLDRLRAALERSVGTV